MMLQNRIRRRPSAENGTTPPLRCAFTGYRPEKMPFGYYENDPRCQLFKLRLRGKIEELIHDGYAHFLSGGALGMDIYAAEIVLELRKQYPWIALEMVIPFDGQAARWTPAWQKRYRQLLNEADMITCTAHAYDAYVMSRRNRYLVNNADLLLAAYDGKPGGTQMTIRYARELGIPVSCIVPVENETGDQPRTSA